MTVLPRMNRITWLVTVLMTGVATLHSAERPKGHLLIIGGGDRTSEIMDRFVALAGGKTSGKVVVIPMASSEPETTGVEQAEQLRSLGVLNTRFIMLTREQALDSSSGRLFDGVTGVFFSGGDQSRLTKILVGTPVLQKLKSLYNEGAVMGGTSAGAAVMSQMMITGDELLNKDSTEAFVFIRKGNVVTTEGFGFLPDVIIDQHFVRRKRHNRLLSLVLENPKLLGVGIDEGTAIDVRGDGTFEVIGEATVLVLDATRARGITTDRNGNLAASDIVVHILAAGDRFNFQERRKVQR